MMQPPQNFIIPSEIEKMNQKNKLKKAEGLEVSNNFSVNPSSEFLKPDNTINNSSISASNSTLKTPQYNEPMPPNKMLLQKITQRK
jgi:hypothetical protein